MAPPAPPARSRAEWLALLARAPRIIPGTPEEIVRDAEWFASALPEHGVLLPGQRVLDFGCGNGKLAIPLTERSLAYSGIDVRADCIAFCRQAFAPWPQFSFECLPVRNAFYSPKARVPPEELVLPYPDQAFDAAVAISVFTHLETESVCLRSLRELRRVLRGGGVLFSTWFRSPPNRPSSKPARRVYPEEDVRRMLGSGFGIASSWGGASTEQHDQWCVVATAL
jgi:SAM-dependent methyltransferase